MKKRENPFVEIYRKCNQGSNKEKWDKMEMGGGTIKYLDLEITNHCNLGCYMCPVGTQTMKRQRGFMSMELIEKLCLELKDCLIGGIRLIRWGEPTMHPQFLDILQKLKETGTLVHFNTNGTLLDRTMIQKIIDLEIDSVKFSFQGVDKISYEEMRYGSSWDTLMENIRLTNELRGDREKPYIQISTTTTMETKEQIDQFASLVEPLCDYYNVGHTKLSHLNVDGMKISDERKQVFRRLQEQENMIKQRLDGCPEVFDKLSVDWDGKVTACCGDYDRELIIGDFSKDSLQEIFQGAKIREIREKLSRNDYGKLPLCKDCYQYIELQK